jgi:hypothetical protein
MRPRLVCALVVLAVLWCVALPASADDVATEVPTTDDVLDSLKRTLSWYQQTRGAARSAGARRSERQRPDAGGPARGTPREAGGRHS